MSEKLVLVEKEKGIATVTLNRPEVLNALSTGLRRELFQTFLELKEDDAIGVVILTGAGRAFSTGLDLKELGKEGFDAQVVMDGIDVHAAIVNLGKPIIGAINGFSVTGGFELALMCDILIATPHAKFADTHSKVGILPGWGLSQKLPRLIGINRAKELSLTGNFLSAEKAEEWGLVNRIVSEEELLPTCKQIAEDILSGDSQTLRTIKRIMDQGWDKTLNEGLRIESEANREHSKSVAPEEIENRRSRVLQRGRGQI